MPLIRDGINFTHPLEEDIPDVTAEVDPNKTMREDALKAIKEKHLGKDVDPVMFDYKFKGSFMEPFTSFYDPKAMEPPLSLTIVKKTEEKIHKECKMAIQMMRASKNLNSPINDKVF